MRRNRCLDELGIVRYRRLADSELDSTESATGGVTKSSDALVEETVRGAAIIADLDSVYSPAADVGAIVERPVSPPSTPTGKEPSANPESKTGSAATAEAALRFRLEWWRQGDLLFATAAVEETGHQQRASLVQNILRALARDPKGCDTDVLQWPLAGVKSNREAAADMLTGFLSGQLEHNGAMTLILAGELVTELLLGGEIAFTELVGARIKLMDDSLQACVLPDLDRMLENPLAKRDAWRALKQLRATAES